MFAGWTTRGLIAQLSNSDTRIVLDLSPDWRVLTFAMVTATAAVIMFGVAPALRATDVALSEVVREGWIPSSTGGVRALNVVLIAQVAVALLLVATAGLFVRTFQQLTRVPLGFEDDRVLSVMITAPHVAPADRNRLYQRLVDTVAALPDVSSAGGALADPLRRFGVPIAFRVPGARRLPEAETLSYGNDITSGWRAAYGTPLRAGRDIDDRDANGALPVMLVNETFVERFFPGENIIGRTLAVTAHIPPDGEISLGARTVVGIVADTVHDSIRAPKRPIIYRPLAQRDGPLFIPLYIAVRPATGSPAEQSNDVVAALHDVDPRLRISARTVADGVDATLAQERLLAGLSLFGGGFALLLAMVGLYGVTAYAVARRRAEIGIRMALGSSPAGVVRLVTSQVLAMVSIGVLLGAVLSAWSSRLLTSLLYGVEPGDPLVLMAAAATFLIAGILAAWLPAHRASLIDPSLVFRGT